MSDQFKSALDELRNSSAEQLALAREKAKDLESEVRREPWFYLAIVGLLSVFLGFILGRASKR